MDRERGHDQPSAQPAIAPALRDGDPRTPEAGTFTDAGPKPPVAHGAPTAARPSASELGFDHHPQQPHGKRAAHADEWVTDRPAADPPGEQPFSIHSLAKATLYDQMGTVAPGLSHDMKVMLLGHAWVEQEGRNIINNNFAGVEGESPTYVMAWTSTQITRAEYEANPSAYKNWGHGGTWRGEDASTIKVQLDRGDADIIVMEHKQRPAYASLGSAAAAFIDNIETKFRKLEASKDPKDRELAQQALGGDAQAYTRIVTMRSPKLGISPYNPDPGYAQRVLIQIAAARTDLAGVK